MDQNVKSPSEEDEREFERFERSEPSPSGLTQRELVRASLLKCPPDRSVEPPRR